MSDSHDIGVLELTSWFCGDCNPEDQERIERHVRSCVLCRRRLEELKQERGAFLERMPYERDLAGARGSSAAERAWWRTPLYAAAALLVAAVGVHVFVNTEPGYRLKGGEESVSLYVRNALGEADARPEHVYYPGERVQFTYSAQDSSWFALIGIDQHGLITTYFPSGSDSSMLIPAGRDLPLPNSIELDGYIGPEVYLAVFSARPHAVSALRDALSRQFSDAGALGSLRFTVEGARVYTIRTVKREAPQ
jgi:hypothetical protein